MDGVESLRSRLPQNAYGIDDDIHAMQPRLPLGNIEVAIEVCRNVRRRRHTRSTRGVHDVATLHEGLRQSSADKTTSACNEYDHVCADERSQELRWGERPSLDAWLKSVVLDEWESA